MTVAPAPVVLEDVSVRFGDAEVLSAVGLTVRAGAWVGLIGPNGAGKTTMLRVLTGLAAADGRVLVGGAPVAGLARREVARRVAYVPQRPVVPDGMTVTDYVLLGRTPYISYFGYEAPSDVAAAEEALDLLELAPLSGRSLDTLSGGELQRAMLARALVQRAPLLLLDEPTAALDIGHQQQALELVDRLRRERSLTVVSAMHDLTLAAQFADELVLLDAGRVVAAGPPAEVLTPGRIRVHFGATVTVTGDGRGGVVVTPTRPAVG